MRTKQATIKTEVSFQGRGLHTGNKTQITFKPAPENYGRKFVRIDIDNSPEIEAIVDNVIQDKITIDLNDFSVGIYLVETTIGSEKIVNY